MVNIKNLVISCTVPRELADALHREAEAHGLKLSKLLPIAFEHFLATGGHDAEVLRQAKLIEKKVSGN